MVKIEFEVLVQEKRVSTIRNKRLDAYVKHCCSNPITNPCSILSPCVPLEIVIGFELHVTQIGLSFIIVHITQQFTTQ